METVGIVLVSLLAGAILLVNMAGMVTLIVLHLRARKMHSELVKAMTEFTGETSRIVEACRSAFGGIRQEIKSAMEGQTRAIGTTIGAHEAKFNEALGKINGEALMRASVEALRALKELSALTVTLKNLLVDHSAPAAELGPEEYGPNDDLFVKQGDTARMDDLTQREENSAYTNQFEAGLPVVRTE